MPLCRQQAPYMTSHLPPPDSTLLDELIGLVAAGADGRKRGIPAADGHRLSVSLVSPRAVPPRSSRQGAGTWLASDTMSGMSQPERGAAPQRTFAG